MRVLSHPLALVGGMFATVEQGSDRQAQQLAQAVLATGPGERPLSPDLGLPDLLGEGVEPEDVVAALDVAEPDVEVVAVDVDGPDVDGEQTVTVVVAWREEDTL